MITIVVVVVKNGRGTLRCDFFLLGGEVKDGGAVSALAPRQDLLPPGFPLLLPCGFHRYVDIRLCCLPLSVLCFVFLLFGAPTDNRCLVRGHGGRKRRRWWWWWVVPLLATWLCLLGVSLSVTQASSKHRWMLCP